MENQVHPALEVVYETMACYDGDQAMARRRANLCFAS